MPQLSPHNMISLFTVLLLFFLILSLTLTVMSSNRVSLYTQNSNLSTNSLSEAHTPNVGQKSMYTSTCWYFYSGSYMRSF
nr:ATP synthase F0 subunit 8 [Candidula unifasciata unifasciata]